MSLQKTPSDGQYDIKKERLLSCHHPLVPPLSFLSLFHVFIFVISSTSLPLHYSNGLSSPNEAHATEPVGFLLGNRTHTFFREKEDKRFGPFLSHTLTDVLCLDKSIYIFFGHKKISKP